MLDLSGFDNLSDDERDYLDEHCHETGAPGQDRRAWLREHPDEQDAEPA